MLTMAYLALITLGCGYILISIFLGHTSDASDAGAAEHAADHGGEAESSYGVDQSGHASTSTGHGGGAAFHFPFFSPLALATLFTCVGAYGLIGKTGFRLADTTSLLLALPGAFLTAYVVTYASWRVARSSTGTSQIRMSQFSGAEGEVITPIPAGGLGEVAVLVDGQRFASAAREENAGAVPRGAPVRVVRMVGQTLVVTASPSEGRR